VLNEGCSFSKSSLKDKENSPPTKMHEAESVRTLGSTPKLLLIAIKSFLKILLSDCGVRGDREYFFFAAKGLKRIRWEGVERYIWLRIGFSGGPFYTRQQLNLRRLMSYIYMEHPFLMFLDTTTQHSR